MCVSTALSFRFAQRERQTVCESVNMEVYECDTHIHKRREKDNMETGERCSRCLNSCFAADMCVRERRRRKRRRRQAPAVSMRASKREMSCVSSGDGGRGDAHVRCARAWTCKCHMCMADNESQQCSTRKEERGLCVCVYERKVNLLAYTQLTITECVYESRCVRAEAIDISVRRGVVLFSLRACEDVWTAYRERQRKTQQ